MKEPNWENVNEEELWKYVCSFLKKNGIDTVLVGGAVAAIYSSGVYTSGDLDLVNINNREEKVISRTLEKLGFSKKGRHFEHQKCRHIFIEFVPPPISIGSDYAIKPREVLVEGVKIKILRPTDCVKDRLASYIYFDARECLDQAVLVAIKQKCDVKDVKNWCENEGGKAKQAYDDFLRLLKKNRKNFN